MPDKEERRMNYMDRYTCPYCGATLDPGEHCDCRDKAAKAKNGSNGSDFSERQRTLAFAGIMIMIMIMIMMMIMILVFKTYMAIDPLTFDL
jgi:hypothetical protein